MLLDWLDDLLSCGVERSGPRLRRSRPRLEGLESRVVPAAIRNLPGFLTNSLAANDDNSTGSVPLGFNVNFFGFMDNAVFVNNNGNVTFTQPLAAFTPTDLNSNNGGIPIIAPFFADVDTRGAGNIVTYGTDTLCGRAAFGVNWVMVNYFSAIGGGHVDLFNSFQLILVERNDTGTGNFDIEFNYDTITWETGDASGGTNGLGGSSARVGYSNGSGTAGTFFELPGSGVPGTFEDTGTGPLIARTQLSSTPGRLHFLVRNGQVLQDIQATGNFDVTSGTHVLNPFRWITDTQTCLQRGFLTLVNFAPVNLNLLSSTDVCLDIASGNAFLDGPFPAPITIVFDALAPGVTLANPTGFTASGRPFIQINEVLPRDIPALRVPILISNPNFDSPTTYFGQDFQIRVFAGTFDPTFV